MTLSHAGPGVAAYNAAGDLWRVAEEIALEFELFGRAVTPAELAAL